MICWTLTNKTKGPSDEETVMTNVFWVTLAVALLVGGIGAESDSALMMRLGNGGMALAFAVLAYRQLHKKRRTWLYIWGALVVGFIGLAIYLAPSVRVWQFVGTAIDAA